MNYILKVIFVALLSILAHNLSFGKTKIELKIDPTTGRLAYPIEPEIFFFGGVEWFTNDPKIKSFQIVEKEGNSRYIFTKRLPTVPTLRGKGLHMKRDFDVDSCLWQYDIIWTNMADVEDRLDPKIPVKPLVFRDLFLVIGLVLIAIASLVFYRTRRVAKAKLAGKNSQISG